MVEALTIDTRYELRGQLGAGAMGTVHRVFDRARDCELALKMLRHHSAAELYRFEREFRALADLSHPNLVTLHELHAIGDAWMFTMELVDGVTFDRWVRVHDARAVAPIPDDDSTMPGPRRASRTPVRATASGTLREDRLRAALRQLADGLCALGDAGKIHRDLKPSNVLVDRDGRVVILDFGLLVDARAARTCDHAAVGTPPYMSPEQAANAPLTTASDWYAVGAMLYEALVGLRPFEGAIDDVLHRKQHEDPPPPRMLADVPADLDALCVRLLDRDPRRRPDARAVLAMLGAAPTAATTRGGRALDAS